MGSVSVHSALTAFVLWLSFAAPAEAGLSRRLYEYNVLIWQDGDIFPGSLDAWQQSEVVATGHVYNLFANSFGWVSYDNADAQMRVINNDPAISCPNAIWSGTTAELCTGTAADDIVAQVWATGYGDHMPTPESSIIAAWQAGALRIAYADIWGETIDLINGYGDAGEDNSPRTDCNSSDRWQIGEGASGFGGAIRDLWLPTCKGDPGKVSDGQYWCSEADAGGVHTNSTVPSHLYPLLVDGGTYNGQAISAIGLTKAAHIHWWARLLYHNRTTDFAAHADALEQACADLIGVDLPGLSTSTPVGPSGQIITVEDCQEVSAAILAVELRAEACPGVFEPLLDPDAGSLCSTGAIGDILVQDFESGLGAWTVGQVPSNPGSWDNREWTVITSLPGNRGGSGAYGPNPQVGDCVTDLDNGMIYLESPPINVPAGASGPIQLAFDHYVSIEESWDGGNVKYRIGGGSWSPVPAIAFTFNGYNGTLTATSGGSDNPLAGEDGFTGANGGSVVGSWGRSQVDLSLVGVDPGDTAQLRWELGTDSCSGWDGWYVDEVRVFSCELPEPSGTLMVGVGAGLLALLYRRRRHSAKR